MPRAFTEVEKETIREKLMASGRECFQRYGLKKTTIEDLTKPAGIAKASFYLFFRSKEELYVEVFMEEIPAMMKRLTDVSFGSTDDAREALILLMRAIIREMEESAMARILMDDPAEIERIASAFEYEEVMQRVAPFFRPMIQRIADAQGRGEIIEGDPFLISYSLGLVKMLVFNRDRIPQPLYEQMIELAPTIIADGLTCPARNRADRPSVGANRP